MTSPTTSTFLTEQQIGQYWDTGYLVVKSLIPGNVVKGVRDRLLGIVEGTYGDWNPGLMQVVDPTVRLNPKNRPIPASVQHPAKHDQVFERLACHRRLQSAMSDLLQGPVKLFTDQSINKVNWITTEQGGRTYYHQDSWYWRVEPKLGANAWIACDEVGPNAIALAVMPGSHQQWKLIEHESYYDDPRICHGETLKPFMRHRIPLDRVDHTKEILVPMSPGDALFFTNYTWHRSEPNRTCQHKFAYAIAYKRI